ncbi:ABC transporter ATP-binding protein [Polaromonas sp.]|uniref:ABC transporter ATP-binding protein n=1 Tax=Polaromonas sp. TaxID=1869339 RepID=UPI0013B7B55B|nr:ABC transporter ATP-binding protein [Polaromonas sp.]NDP63241.1 ABC transporter ATP-binding protein [Polaromonas sp.]
MNKLVSDVMGTAGGFAIQAKGLGKAYQSASSPGQRLRSALFGRKAYGDDAFWALRDLSLEIPRGEVLGVIGRNGAGKSTLLQLLCGTIAPSTGSISVNGRVAALLELGAGFNPDFSGRDNVLLNGPLLGISREQLLERLDSIIEFSGIGQFIDHPVKTYSSGMFVRLAFSLATSVDPDILIIDEALSVGDGEFSRKSFDRIFAMKERGTTILFCSHSLYQVEAFCTRVMWLNDGVLQAIGEPHEVVREYDLFLAGNGNVAPTISEAKPDAEPAGDAPVEAHEPVTRVGTAGYARISRATVGVDGAWMRNLHVRPGESSLSIMIEFESDPLLPPPTAGVTIDLPNKMALTCSVARTDGLVLDRDAQGRGVAIIDFPRIPLRKGNYHIGVYLGSENAVHIYDSALCIATLTVQDVSPEPGLVTLPHRWHSKPGLQADPHQHRM